MNQQAPGRTPIEINDDSLRAWALPMPSKEGDKEERGRVMIIGGSPEIPGAMLLAANAALRAGAGKVTLAAGESIARQLAIAVPETRVIALPETPGGGVALGAAEALDKLITRYDAVLIGPGMQDEPAVCALVMALLPKLEEVKVILDASAMGVVRRQLQAVGEHGEGASPPKFITRFHSPVLLTPHAGEMAHLTQGDKEEIAANPAEAAEQAARRWNALVAMKGPTTIIAAPDGRTWRHEGGNIGLAVSGSGDTLSGIIAGLAGRGAPLEQACAWGVALHARAGDRLSSRVGLLGYLAREIPAEIPALLQALQAGLSHGDRQPDK